MKKFAYITGALASISLVGGALFKIQHWPGANIMLLIGTLTLSMFFIPYFFYVNLKEQTEKKSKVIAAFGLITALFLCAGALFKILHWPGAIVMISGFGISFLIFLPLYIVNGVRNPLTKVASISNGFLFAAIGGFVILLSFQQPSRVVTDSMVIIQNNEEELLRTLQQQYASDIPSPYTIALEKFVASCDNAVLSVRTPAAGTPVGNGTMIGNGDAVDGQQLMNLNAKLKASVDELNKSMSGSTNWKPLESEEIFPTLYGSVKFQVMQLEEKAYLNAMR